MEPETLILGLGILLGMVYTHRTGWGCGGILTPGLLALHASQPSRLAAALGIGVLLALPLALGVRRFGLYGQGAPGGGPAARAGGQAPGGGHVSPWGPSGWAGWCRGW